MSPPKFSRLDPAQRRDQILDAASALFAERAYDEVSIEGGLPRSRVANVGRTHPPSPPGRTADDP